MSDDNSKNYVYYRIAYSSVSKRHQKIVRVDTNSIDNEWKAMCSDPNRTFPMETFNPAPDSFENSSRFSFSAVQLHLLRKIPETQNSEIHELWVESLPGGSKHVQDDSDISGSFENNETERP